MAISTQEMHKTFHWLGWATYLDHSSPAYLVLGLPRRALRQGILSYSLSGNTRALDFDVEAFTFSPP
jgi:hypothetical protein